MNNNNIRITYPDSEKVYMQGSLHPDVRVGMRKVSLTPTVTVKDGKKIMTENPPVYLYDTSGPYSDTATLRRTSTCGAVCPESAKSGYWNGRWSSCLR